MPSQFPPSPALEPVEWTEAEDWRDRRHDLMDELARLGAGMPAYSLHADPVIYLDAPDLPPSQPWLWPTLARVARGLVGALIPAGRFQRH